MSDLVERLKQAALLLPIRRNDNADYAEVFGQDFQAMTMTPERFEALNALPEAADRITALEAELAATKAREERLRAALGLRPAFDGILPMARKLTEVANRISGRRGEKPCHPDPVMLGEWVVEINKTALECAALAETGGGDE